MVAGKLKAARIASGMSLHELETKTGRTVTAQAIGEYERGEAMPGSRALIALARALDVPVDYLLADEDWVLECIDFERKTIGRQTKARAELTVQRQLGRYLTVESLLGLPSGDWDRPHGAPYPVGGNPAEADRAAHRLRNAWGLGMDPIPSVVELLEGRGIKVLAADIDGIDCIVVQASRAGRPLAPVVLVSPSHAGERQRLAVARQLGRLVMDVANGVDEEAAAHRFADSFLTPAEAPCAQSGNSSSVLAPERPKRFERLCRRALAEDAIGESRAAELLGISVRELDDRLRPAATPL